MATRARDTSTSRRAVATRRCPAGVVAAGAAGVAAGARKSAGAGHCRPASARLADGIAPGAIGFDLGYSHDKTPWGEGMVREEGWEERDNTGKSRWGPVH